MHLDRADNWTKQPPTGAGVSNLKPVGGYDA